MQLHAAQRHRDILGDKLIRAKDMQDGTQDAVRRLSGNAGSRDGREAMANAVLT